MWCTLITTALCSAPQATSDLPVLTAGRTVEAQLRVTHPEVHTESLDRDYTTAPTRGRAYRVQVPSTGWYRVELRSHLFDAYLVLRDAAGRVLAEDDDGLNATHAQIAVELQAGAVYRLQACALHGEHGSYQVAIGKGTPAVTSVADQRSAGLRDARSAVQVRTDEHGATHHSTLFAASLLAACLQDIGELAEAAEVCADIQRHSTDAAFVAGATTPMALCNVGDVLRARGEYQHAEPVYRRALEISEAVRGHNHEKTAVVVSRLAGLLDTLQRFDEAGALHRRALAICEQRFGRYHVETSASVNNLGMSHFGQQRIREAEKHFREALEIRETVLGAGHPQTAKILTNLGNTLSLMQQFDEAEARFRRALAICEDNLPPGHRDIATSLIGLAGFLEMLGRYEEAEQLYARALTIREQVLGANHPDTAISLTKVAMQRQALGDFDAAGRLFESALETVTSRFGATHSRTAGAVTSLAALLQSQGRYEEAEPLYRRALAIYESIGGADDPAVARALIQLARLLQEQHRLDEAEAPALRALQICEQVHGSEHFFTANAIDTVASLRFLQGRAESAEQLARRGLKIRSALPEHPNTAANLVALASFLLFQGKLEEAEGHYRRALTIFEKVYGDHTQTATTLGNLAVLLGTTNKHDEARALQLRALAIRQRIVGPNHPETAIALSNLAQTELALGQRAAAQELSVRALHSVRAHLHTLFDSATEADRFRYVRQKRTFLESLLSLATDPSGADDANLDQAYQEVLSWKGQVFRSTAWLRERVFAQLSDEQRSRLDDLRKVRALLSRLASINQIRDPEGHRERLADVMKRREGLEEEVLDALSEKWIEEPIGVGELCAKLPANSILLDFYVHSVAWDRVGPDQAAPEASAQSPGPRSRAHLSVWIGKPGATTMQHLDLGRADRIESAIKQHMEDLVAKRGRPIKARPGVRAIAARIRKLLWDPLRDHVGNAELVFVSPDLFLATLPFEVVQEADGSFLIEKHGFVYTQDAQSLVRRAPSGSRLAAPTLLTMGAVDYDARRPPSDPITDATGHRAGDEPFYPLSETSHEIAAIADLHRRQFGDTAVRRELRDDAATEHQLKRALPQAQIAHLATHGFFRSDSADELQRLPGLLSGVACAGANLPPEPGRDEGRLTAQEVGWLDLGGCDLVVLSACQTGLGRAESGEGLMSLRRAFRHAGAKTVISSLWNVRDYHTRKLMVDFYRRRWQLGQGRLEALRGAQLEMLKHNRKTYKVALPSQWGAFVVSGEWR